MKPYKNIDEYINNFPEEVQQRLTKIREMIHEYAPQAEEKIGYGVPATTLNGKYLLYFAGYKKHISIYPVTTAMEREIKDIEKYRTGKGTVQFSLDIPLPISLIQEMIKVRTEELSKKA